MSSPASRSKETSDQEAAASNSEQQKHQQLTRVSRSDTYKTRGTSQYSLPTFLSRAEQQIVDCKQPIAFPNTPGAFVKAGKHYGLQLNLSEELEFKGPRSLSTYDINDDPSPLVIRKQSAPVSYTQQVTLK
jgi:hypothetical protein